MTARMMAKQMPCAVLFCLTAMLMHPESTVSDRTNQTYLIPCQNAKTYFTFPGDTESHLHISTDPNRRRSSGIHCRMNIGVPRGKFLSLKFRPFEPGHLCGDIGILLEILSLTVHPCDRNTIYHSEDEHADLGVTIGDLSVPFNATITVRALAENGRRRLQVTHHTRLSGTIAPYDFDGFTDLARYMDPCAVLKPPPGYSVMVSFPHFHLKPMPGCIWSFLQLHLDRRWGQLLWRHCGNLQLPPELYSYYSRSYVFSLYVLLEKGYSGILMRYSLHKKVASPEKTLTNDSTTAVFNCSVPYYTTFSQHLMCNLETECVHAEDEAMCPYWQGDCPPGLLNAGGKCYKYVKTRNRMTWYDASSDCLKQGLNLASFPTSKQGEAFRDGILRYAPITFKTFIGLRTSESSLPAIYREVWRWSSGIMAYYVDIDSQQLFKPTCVSFAALYRERLSTTLCGFYEYMHYIFCEPEITQFNKVGIFTAQMNSTFSQTNHIRFVTCPEGHLIHDFLSCDHESRCAIEPGVKTCVTFSSNKFDLALRSVDIFMFVCGSRTQTMHYTQVCDHQTQCFDSSDESFCIYRMCSEKQCLNQQCVTTAQWCDGMAHCADGSDEACPQFMTVSSKPPSASTQGFHVVLLDGYGKYKYIPQGNEYPVCPPTHFMCSNRELCLPVYLRCNGVNDCADKEDEDNCQGVKCPGFYRCRQSAVCVHSDHVCDGMFQCPQQDDELLCQLVCPDNCLCQGLAFVCTKPFPVYMYPDLRYLDASGSGLSPHLIVHNHYLVRLSLSKCGLKTLPTFNLPNLNSFYLDDNNFAHVNIDVFLKLSNLIVLSLSRNPIIKLVRSDTKVVLHNVHSLDLSHARLKYFESETLQNFRILKSLNMSYGKLKVVGESGFRFLTRIESLDLRGSRLTKYPLKMLQSLSYLRILFSDTYKLCCQEILPEHFNTHSCHASHTEFASCKDLLRSNMYRMFLWISCCVAVFGNVGSFFAKLYMQKNKSPTSFNIFIYHINISDFCMGLYLIVIGSADQVYRGSYLWYDQKWKASASCKAAGFFSLLSCEMSALVICLITLDRFLVLRFPFSQARFNNTSAQVVCGLCWMVSIVVAALPLLPVLSRWEFYSQSDICIPLPVTKRDFEGQFYSFGIMIVFNFIVFVLIAIGQLFIYMAIRVNSMETEQRHDRETTVARRLLTVVMSDFLCWFPIGLCGLLASNGVFIPDEVNVAMAIFALPINSALNPFLYTFNLLMEKRRKASEKRLLKILQKRYSNELQPS